MIETRNFALGRDFSPLHAVDYYLMRTLPYRRVRRLAAGATSLLVRLRGCTLEDAGQQDDIRSASIAAQMRAEGFARMTPLLSPKQIEDMHRYLADKPLLDKRNRSFPATNIPKDVRRASYSLHDVMMCPHVVEAINRPGVLHIAREYLGCTPTISSIGIHMTIPSESTLSDVQQFHRDPDGWHFLKLFVYLTDVDTDSGPHEYIATSHARSGRLKSLIYSDAEVMEEYGEGSMRRVLGPRGTTFIADTWGIHKGGAGPKARLMLQVQYSILPVAKFRYRPVTLPVPAQVDRYVNRLLLA